MSPSFPRRLLVLLPLLALGAGGCVVNDIHDEMKLINTNMDETQEILTTSLGENLTAVRQVSGGLDEISRSLDDAIARLETVEASLEATNSRLDVVARDLGAVNTSLGTLASIDRSLTANAAHLAALRTTISKIDSSIPFITFSDDDDAAATTSAEPVVPAEQK